MFPEQIETERLVLEQLSREHVDIFEFYQVCSRHEPDIEEVTRHLSWEPHETPKQTMDFIAHSEKQFEDGEGATYVIRPREGEDGPGEIAGGTGFDVDWDRRTATLGMWLRKPFWGRGYSGERAAALIEIVFDQLDLELVVVTHHVNNENSRRAIEKYVERFGGRHEGLMRNFSVDPDGTIIDQHRYSISRKEYRQSTA